MNNEDMKIFSVSFFFLFFRGHLIHPIIKHIRIDTEGVTISLTDSISRYNQPRNSRTLKLGLLRLSSRFVDKRLVNVWDHSTTGDGGLDKCVKFLISTNSKLQVTRCDTLHLKILTGVTGQFEYLSR